MIELHNYLNPNQITYIEAGEIASIQPSGNGDGSLISLKGGFVIGVKELPAEVARLKGETK